MRFCAQQHLPDEISLLQPHGICFLGATNAAPAAEAIFRHRIGEVPEQCEIRSADVTEAWEGWVVATVQPVRGTKEGRNRERAAKSIEQLRDALAKTSQSLSGNGPTSQCSGPGLALLGPASERGR